MFTRLIALLTGVIVFAAFAGVMSPVCAAEQEIAVRDAAVKEPVPVLKLMLNKRDGVFAAGEDIVFVAKLTSRGKSMPGEKITYRIFVDGVPEGEAVSVSAAEPARVVRRYDRPVWVKMVADAAGKHQEKGAVVAPELWREGVPEPADFDQFWSAQRAALDAVPLKAVATPVEAPSSDSGKLVCYDVKVDCAGNAPVSGYLVMPENAAPKSLPAVVNFHGYGVRSAEKQNMGGQKAMVFDVNAHGLPNGESAEYYKQKSDEFGWYAVKGRESRDEFVFKDMFLRVMRALDYVKSRPEWDGKTLIVRGGSQGGGQAIVAAALDKDVTYCIAAVPALGDHGGSVAGRLSGWPALYKPGDDPRILETARYFDNNNFAKRIHCEIDLSTGLIDTICPPSSVFTVYNSLPQDTPKRMYTVPDMGHDASNPGANSRFYEILGN